MPGSPRPVARVTRMHCLLCGTAAVQGQALCGSCGTHLPGRCAACDALNPVDAAFCMRCGAAVSAHAPAVAVSGERRQLSVMFCDLVESTALSTRLDPEDLHEVIRGFQEVCAAVVKDRQGFVAKYMGDGMIAYFGYPLAHEDDAERAINAGLQIVDAVAGLGRRGGQPLDVRVGIATGLVVIGDLLGAGPAAEVVGTTPSLAARLQGLAQPGAVVISDQTRQMAGGLFSYEDLGTSELRGFAAPVQAWRVVAPRHASSRFAALHDELPALFGRAAEFSTIMECWTRAKQGAGQVVLISGQNGIGKSHVVQAVREHLVQEGAALRYYRAPMYQSRALRPVARQIEREAGIGPEDPPDLKRQKLDDILEDAGADMAALTPVLADLLAIPAAADDVPPKGETKPRIEQTLDALVRRDLRLAAVSPALIILEDAHWADPATLRLIGRLVEQGAARRLLMLITHRADYVPGDWSAAAHVVAIRLGELGRDDCAAMVQSLAGGKPLPAAVVDEIATRTNGIPLFDEELTKMVLQSGALEEGPDGFILTQPLANLAIPASLNEVLLTRIDRLGSAKEVAQIAAVLGHTFTRTQLTSIAAVGDRDLDSALDRLAAADIIHRVPGGAEPAYSFRTPLIRDAARETLLRSRRRELHRRTAQMLERVYPATSRNEPELLAYHYMKAGLAERSVAFWRRAAQRALARHANGVAIGHLQRALELLAELPETAARKRDELDCRTALGTALMTFHSYAVDGVGANFARAHALAEEIGDDNACFRALRGLCLHNLGRAEHQQATALAAQAAALAARTMDPPCEMEGHRLVGTCAFFTGGFAASEDHLRQVMARYEAGRDRPLAGTLGQDPRVMSGAYLAWTQWITGRTDAALATMAAAVALSGEIGHPLTTMLAEVFATVLHCLNGDPAAARRHAAACQALAGREGLPYFTAFARVAEGSALAADACYAEAIEPLRRGMALWRGTGSRLCTTLFTGTLASALMAVGRLDEAAAALHEAQGLVAAGERFWEAELQRLDGMLQLATVANGTKAAEARFEAAAATAQQQNRYSTSTATASDMSYAIPAIA